VENVKEVILLGGMSGTGKTTCCLQIAKAYPEARVYYIDTDGSAERVLRLEFPEVKNITYARTLDWDSCSKAIKGVKDAGLKRGDWVMVDLIDNIWTYDQRDFIKQIYGADESEYLMQRRLEMKERGKKAILTHNPQDWSIMSTRYMELLYILWYRLHAHLIATTSISEAPGGAYPESLKAKQFYGSLEKDFGFRYDGHKENLYRFESHLVLAQDRNGYYLTTVKERGSRVRRMLKRVPLHNFVLQYLYPVAGFPIPSKVG